MKLFKVEAKCGHVGKGKCIYIWFPVKAESAAEAAAKAREYKRVKHHHKDAIREVCEISYIEYLELQLSNSQDGYLQCKNIQQQRLLKDFEQRIEADLFLLSKQNRSTHKRDVIFILKKSKIQARDTSLQIKEAASMI